MVVMRGRIGMPRLFLVFMIAVRMIMMMTSLRMMRVIVTMTCRTIAFIGSCRRMIVRVQDIPQCAGAQIGGQQ